MVITGQNNWDAVWSWKGYLDEITVLLKHFPSKSLRHLTQKIRISSVSFISLAPEWFQSMNINFFEWVPRIFV